MEVSLLEICNNKKDAILAPESNGISNELQSTNITVHDDDDTNIESKDCNHFSIREYVAQASKRDPRSCSPFVTDKLSLDLLPPLPQKKFRQWDCSGCVSKVTSTVETRNVELALSSDQSANNNVGTCLIKILATTTPVPLSIPDNAQESKYPPFSMNESNSKKDMACATIGGCHFQEDPHAVSPDTSDNEPLSTFIKSEKRRVMQEPQRTKARTEYEKIKEIDELMATTSKNSDLPESPAASKSKGLVKKARKVRSIAEIIGADKSVPPKNGFYPCDGMAKVLAPVKERKVSEVAGKSGFIPAKLKNKSKALEVGMPSLEECAPDDGMDEDLAPIKDKLASAITCKSMLSMAKTKKSHRTLKLVVPPRKDCTPIDCMDEDLTPMKKDSACEIASTSGLIKAKSKTKCNALGVVDGTSIKLWLKKGKKTTHNKCARVKNSEGQSVTCPSSRLLGCNKPSVDTSDKNEFLIATVVRRKRTKKPRKIVYAAGIGDGSGCTKSCHKPLHLTGSKEANSKIDLFKKRKMDGSAPQRSAYRVQKKKQKISENISNDIPMDIVELLARSLRDKHLTDETDSNSNSNSRQSAQNMPPPNRKAVNFSRQKSAFIRTSETGVSEYVPRPMYFQSSTRDGNISLSTTRLDPAYGYMNYFQNGSVILQPGNGRCLDYGCALLPPNANPVHPTGLYRNEVIPATHLLQLMNAPSSSSSSPNLNLRSFASPYYNPPLMPSHYQSLNQNPCKLFRPQPRLGVLGSQLQKEITSPSSNCGTQSGYRIGNGSIPAEGICTLNRNPADFTVIDENNEYMIEGSEIKPLTGVFAGNWDHLLYLSRGIGSERGIPRSRHLYTRVVN